MMMGNHDSYSPQRLGRLCINDSIRQGRGQVPASVKSPLPKHGNGRQPDGGYGDPSKRRLSPNRRRAYDTFISCARA